MPSQKKAKSSKNNQTTNNILDLNRRRKNSADFCVFEVIMSNLKKLVGVLLTLAIVLSLSVVFVACNEPAPQPDKTFVKADESADGYATVYIPSDRDINILLLSDPQVDTTQKYTAVGSLGNDVTFDFIKDLVSSANPDFVIINGDLVMADGFLGFNPSQVPLFTRYGELFDEIKMPWAFTFGNHDCDGQYADEDATIDDEYKQITKAAMVEYMAEFEYCMINSDENCADGDGNYFINVRRQDESLAYTLCLFDCVYDEENKTYSRTPTAEQVRWYRDTVNSLSDVALGKDRTDVVKSMIFNHVGIPEFKTAWDEAWNKGNPTENYHYGYRLQGNYTSNYGDMPEDEQIFSVAKALESTTAIFMCHHHDNDFSVDYQGIRLTFGQHSGVAHNYRTTHDNNGITMSDWKGISFELVDNYGDDRGGTTITISTEGNFTVSQTFARDVIPDYYDDYYIDYDAVAAEIEANAKYDGTVKRGTDRKWKKAE